MSLKKYKIVLQQLKECNPNAYLFDGFEEAIIGMAEQFTNPTVACYDYEKCIKILMTRDKMKRDEAEEYFEFNVSGLGLGPNTPVILRQP
jgi:hypothetical protein